MKKVFISLLFIFTIFSSGMANAAGIDGKVVFLSYNGVTGQLMVSVSDPSGNVKNCYNTANSASTVNDGFFAILSNAYGTGKTVNMQCTGAGVITATTLSISNP